MGRIDDQKFYWLTCLIYCPLWSFRFFMSGVLHASDIFLMMK